MSTLSLPIIDFEPYLQDPNSEAAIKECEKAAETLIKYSALAVRNPNVTEHDNNIFLDLVEDYFNQPLCEKVRDVRKEYSYQVGATPANTEVPKCGRDEPCLEFIKHLTPEDRPSEFDKPDPKWRFFWRIGERPTETRFKELNADQVIPHAFPQWKDTMNTWGTKLLDSITILSEMVAIGLGLRKDTFTSMANMGPHLLAPTASDLETYGKVGTVLAGFHYDLNFLTIHGKSRFPGLYIWERNGKKLAARIPDGCLLVQAGKQMEWLTGGKITSGYHEVVVNDSTLEAMKRQKEKQRPLWRISSTLFYHIASDQMLLPLSLFATEEATKKYTAMYTGDHVKMELGLINLAGEE